VHTVGHAQTLDTNGNHESPSYGVDARQTR
jgi:hypothetical protein